ncbi:MAG TPA: thioredoxin family protein [Haploplasma sp.]|nr:thioredoxin family protein [Haploplasma sp.]
MIKYQTDKTIKDIIANNEKDNIIMVFGKGTNCSVCHAIEDRVNKTFPDLYPNLPIHFINIDDSPSFRGQHLIFSVPTLLIFEGSKEVHRESRIVDFNKLYKVLDLLTT